MKYMKDIVQPLLMVRCQQMSASFSPWVSILLSLIEVQTSLPRIKEELRSCSSLQFSLWLYLSQMVSCQVTSLNSIFSMEELKEC